MEKIACGALLGKGGAVEVATEEAAKANTREEEWLTGERKGTGLD